MKNFIKEIFQIIILLVVVYLFVVAMFCYPQ